MKRQSIPIHGIPALLWGEASPRLCLYAHGRHARKEEAAGLAEVAQARGMQVLSFDLPRHGERAGEAEPCTVQNGVRDLARIGAFASGRWEDLSFFGCSLGAYFGLMALGELKLRKALLQSPILDMERLIRNLMGACGVSEADLLHRQEIPTAFGEDLSWPYFSFVRKHPITRWEAPTAILWGTRDEMTEPEVVQGFARRFRCRVTAVEGAGHFFQAPEHLEALRSWMDLELPGGAPR